ncbi:LOW QUALITY PROTEIN: Pol protein [Phytophthora palmivora]|uniref:Pol protein n=1 Tax=Phytophthora palmivora TaxID=4796 RepID=A0A2P4YTM0_9STRA|nr:LOW QUALITY PROTEIN: Pol protein [Phytophthora palmivora]
MSVCAETPKLRNEQCGACLDRLHPVLRNGLTHPCVLLTPSRRDTELDGGEVEWLTNASPTAVWKQVDDFLSVRLSNLRHVRDAMAEIQDVQKEQADARGRRNVWKFEVGDLVLLNAKNLPTHAVFEVFKTKLRPRFIGPVVAKKGLAYKLNRPKKMRTYPVFYVDLLKPYRDSSQVSAESLASRGKPTATVERYPVARSPEVQPDPAHQRPDHAAQHSNDTEPPCDLPAGLQVSQRPTTLVSDLDKGLSLLQVIREAGELDRHPVTKPANSRSTA